MGLPVISMKKYIAAVLFTVCFSLPVFSQYKLKLTELRSGKSFVIREKRHFLNLYYQINDSTAIYRTDVVDRIDANYVYFARIGRLSHNSLNGFSIHRIRNMEKVRFINGLPFMAFFGLLAGIVNVSVNPGFRDGPTLYIGGAGAALSIATYSLWRRHRVKYRKRIGKDVRLEVVRE